MNELATKDLVTTNEYPVSSNEELSALIARNRQEDWPDLDFKKKAFAYKYILNYDHRGAAKAVGYGKGMGIKLLRDPLLASLITDLQEMQRTSDLITKDFINTQYLHLLDCSMGRVDISMVTAMGATFEGRKTDIGSAVNILKEISKSTEYARDTGNKLAPVHIDINFNDIMGNKEIPLPVIEVEVNDQ